jgi:hypothetical protein
MQDKQINLFGGPLPQIAAFTLWQPWASLVVKGWKAYETRRRPTDYRGPLFIHASKISPAATRGKFSRYLTPPGANAYFVPEGAIIGICTVQNCEEAYVVLDRLNSQHDLEEQLFGDYGPNRYAWQLSDALEFKNSIPYKGYQCIFDPVRARKQSTDILQLGLELEAAMKAESKELTAYRDIARALKDYYEQIRISPLGFPVYKTGRKKEAA